METDWKRSVLRTWLRLLLPAVLLLLVACPTLQGVAFPPLLRARQNYDSRRQSQQLAANVFLRFLRLTPDTVLHGDGTVCVWQGHSCDPFGVPCCQDMFCLNMAWGYCIPGREQCRCLPVKGPDTYALSSR